MTGMVLPLWRKSVKNYESGWAFAVTLRHIAMKRASVLFLTFLYLLPATGFSMGMHLCGNKVTSVHIEYIGSDVCACGKEMKGGCCKNILVAFKIEDNQKAAAEVCIAKNDFSKQIFVSTQFVQFVSYVQPNDFEFPDYHAPPPDGKRPVYLNNRVFRI